MSAHALKNVFENSFARWSEKPAIAFFRHGDAATELTYGQLDQNANRLAHTFESFIMFSSGCHPKILRLQNI
jgi:acyl-CoA synthetase (AMP-forming)/AMP-acid ligase II